MKKSKRILVVILSISLILIGIYFVLPMFNTTTDEQSELSAEQIDGLTNGNSSNGDELEPEPNTSNEMPTSPSSDTDLEAGKYTPQTAPAPFQVQVDGENVLIVNKKHPLPANYNPGENSEAVVHVRELIEEAQAAGVDVIYSWSGFRSYSTQVDLYNNYVKSSGQVAADTFSARPGYSEHQTGLVFDLKHSSGALYRSDDDSYDYNTDWIATHAAKFGFIVRYRDQWQPVTGYMGEPWHLRYLGTELAAKVYQSEQPLETYCGIIGGDY